MPRPIFVVRQTRRYSLKRGSLPARSSEQSNAAGERLEGRVFPASRDFCPMPSPEVCDGWARLREQELGRGGVTHAHHGHGKARIGAVRHGQWPKHLAHQSAHGDDVIGSRDAADYPPVPVSLCSCSVIRLCSALGFGSAFGSACTRVCVRLGARVYVRL